jgi:hypothetical protein
MPKKYDDEEFNESQLKADEEHYLLGCLINEKEIKKIKERLDGIEEFLTNQFGYDPPNPEA